MKSKNDLLAEIFKQNFGISSQSQILQRMLLNLSSKQNAANRPQPQQVLTTHDIQDPTVALLDAYAAVLHVLDFYQQQYSQENYLATATELRSIHELARTMGYKLRPAIAASTSLAFTIDANANNTGLAMIPKGTKIQSIPSNGELPQTFETSADLEARAEWNQLQPYQQQQTLFPIIQSTIHTIDIAGTANRINIGDILLLSGISVQSDKPVYYQLKVLSVNLDNKNNKTTIGWQSGWANGSNDLSLQNITLADTEILDLAQMFIFRKKAACFGNNAPLQKGLTTSYSKGSNDWDSKVPNVWQDSQTNYHHVDKNGKPDQSLIYLDQVLSKINGGDFILLVDGVAQKLYKVVSTNEAFVADFAIGSRVTILNLTNDLSEVTKNLSDPMPATNDTEFSFRTTTVYIESELLPFFSSSAPVDEILTNKIRLDKRITFLPPGKQIIFSTQAKKVTKNLSVKAMTTTENVQKIILHKLLVNNYVQNTLTVSGVGIAQPIPATLAEDSTSLVLTETIPVGCNLSEIQLSGVLQTYSEVAIVDNCKYNENGLIEILLKSNLRQQFNSSNTIVFANAITATHGETVSEILGSGDATQANQQFMLKQSPLTYLPAPNIKGVENCLKIYTDDQMQWEEGNNFIDLSSDSRQYVVEQNDQGQTNIVFGDGKHGARLPSGQENIKAVYRYGSGELGNIPANTLKLMQTRPPGVNSVDNPIPATGGTATETLEQARNRIPQHVLTMGRIVSLQDYTNFVLTYAGISKVQTYVLRHSAPLLFITIAGFAGAPVTPDTMLYQNLHAALAELSNPAHNIYIQSYEPKIFNLDATISKIADFRSTELLDTIKQTLLTYFGFDQRNLAQSVTAAEVMQVIQSISGVAGVQLEKLYCPDNQTTPAFNAILKAEPARLNFNAQNEFSAAQLLTINPLGIRLTIASS